MQRKNPKIKYKHYVIMSTCVDSDMCNSHHIIAVAHSFSKAKKKLKAEVIAEKEIIKSEQANFNVDILTETDEVFKYIFSNRLDVTKYYGRVSMYIIGVPK